MLDDIATLNNAGHPLLNELLRAGQNFRIRGTATASD